MRHTAKLDLEGLRSPSTLQPCLSDGLQTCEEVEAIKSRVTGPMVSKIMPNTCHETSGTPKCRSISYSGVDKP